MDACAEPDCPYCGQVTTRSRTVTEAAPACWDDDTPLRYVTPTTD